MSVSFHGFRFLCQDKTQTSASGILIFIYITLFHYRLVDNKKSERETEKTLN